MKTARVAATLTRILLLLYPPAFRREMGEALVGDVRRRAAEKGPLWLAGLSFSLVANAMGAWTEAIRPGLAFSWIDLKLAFRLLLT